MAFDVGAQLGSGQIDDRLRHEGLPRPRHAVGGGGRPRNPSKCVGVHHDARYAGFLGGRFGLNRPLSLNARIVGDEDEIFLAGLADVGVMAGSAGDGNRIDARHSSIRNLTMTGLAASGR